MLNVVDAHVAKSFELQCERMLMCADGAFVPVDVYALVVWTGTGIQRQVMRIGLTVDQYEELRGIFISTLPQSVGESGPVGGGDQRRADDLEG